MAYSQSTAIEYMSILITGTDGFVGQNLAAALHNIQNGNDRTRPNLTLGDIWEYDMDTDPALLEQYCSKADFVFHLAGINCPRNEKGRSPQNSDNSMQGYYDLTLDLLGNLKKYNNTCPVIFFSSIQATSMDEYETGHYSNYGRCLKDVEELVFHYAKESGAKVLIYRLPDIFGKWCRPDSNSVITTLCYNMANDLPVTVNDSSVQLELLYIDDILAEMLDALEGREHHCTFDGIRTVFCDDGKYCAVPTTHKVTLGEIIELLEAFKAQPQTLVMPEIPTGSFAKKLYSTYLSYLPKEKIAFPLKMNEDARGSFTELLKTANCGQFSVNILKPEITKGQHWHHTKWEFFIVVSGHGLIQMRKIGSEEVLNFEVSGDKIEAVHMLPGYTHNIINLSKTENLVTVMWANEQFDPNHPDTFYEQIKKNPSAMKFF